MPPNSSPKTADDDAPPGPSLSDWSLEHIVTPRGGSGTAVIHNPTGLRYDYTFADSLVDGVAHPPFIRENAVRAQRSQLEFREDDVFVATFSKCGTTLAEQIVLLLLNDGDDGRLNPLHKNTYDRQSGVGKIWTEMAVVDGLRGLDTRSGVDDAKACMGEGKARMSVGEFDALSPPRVLKTHAPPRLFLDQKRRAKVVYVTRNPFDACVSCYYHPKPGVSPQSNGMPFDAFCRLWLSESVEFGGWIEHTKAWYHEYQNSYGEDRMLWVSYEQLVTKPFESIKSIGDFLGVDTDEALIKRVADGCKFDKMKQMAQNMLGSGAQGNISHLRKGIIGDWRTHVTDGLFRQFEAEIRDQCSKSGVDLEYDIGNGQVWKTAVEDGREKSGSFEIGESKGGKEGLVSQKENISVN